MPFTLQTFAVCLNASLLGMRGGLWSADVYLLAGTVGALVFAGFWGGLDILAVMRQFKFRSDLAESN